MYFRLFLLIVVLVVFYSVIFTKNKILYQIDIYKLCLKHPFINKIAGCEEYFSSKLKLYKWINPKDEKSLINKMGFQKTVISPSKEEIPGTDVKILNFSSKSDKELDINNGEKRPFYFFSKTYITPPVYFYTIKDALVFLGEDTRKFLVFKNGFYTLMGRENDSLERILPKLIEKEDVFYEEQNGNIYFAKDLIELPKIKNKTIFFHGDCNLYHIILETSPGLLLINDTDYKINLSYFSKQNTDIVEALRNPHIIPTKLFSLEKFSELIIPSLILENNAHFPNIELMKKLIKKLQINFSEKMKIKPLGKKIYVSRADASRRKILNEVELMEHLEKRGFKMLIPGKYNIAEQSKLFEDAEIIIGPHGLGLVNMLFSNNLKTVIELFTITHAPNCYLRTAQVKGVKNYYGLFHDAADPATMSWLADYNVNIPEILKILDELEK
jgi:hypothetical protein